MRVEKLHQACVRFVPSPSPSPSPSKPPSAAKAGVRGSCQCILAFKNFMRSAGCSTSRTQAVDGFTEERETRHRKWAAKRGTKSSWQATNLPVLPLCPIDAIIPPDVPLNPALPPKSPPPLYMPPGVPPIDPGLSRNFIRPCGFGAVVARLLAIRALRLIL